MKQTKNVTLTHQFSRCPEMKFLDKENTACCWGAFFTKSSDQWGTPSQQFMGKCTDISPNVVSLLTISLQSGSRVTRT